MNSESHRVPDSQDSTERISSEPHMSYSSQILQRSVFLLKRISHRIAFTVNFYGFRFNFNVLTASERLNQFTSDSKTGSCGYLLENIFADNISLGDDLNIIYRGAVIKSNEFNLLVTALSSHPTFGKNILTRLHLEQLLDFSP